MRPISPRTIYLFSSSSSSYSPSAPLFSLQISHLLPSSSSAKHLHTYSSRRDEELRNVRVSVWWDFENCNLPVTVRPFKVASAITSAVRANGIKGPIQITAFGDIFQLSRFNQEALSSTGINLTHVPRGQHHEVSSLDPRPGTYQTKFFVIGVTVLKEMGLIIFTYKQALRKNVPPYQSGSKYNTYEVSIVVPITKGGKNSADRSLLADLMYWVSQNPPPAHLFLISGDRDFASILHRLRMNNYNILLASPGNAPAVLCSAASIMWPWHALLMGENLTGKYFNQPPDGPYGSWYGHYKVPLEDPFSFIEQPVFSPAAKLSEPGSDSKLQMMPNGAESKLSPIPRTVVNEIRNVLKSYPNGISVTDLRARLEKCNLGGMDRPYYGYKKFSCFLASMPHILRLQPVGNGNYMIHGVTAKSAESHQRNRDSDNGDQLDCEDISTRDTVGKKWSSLASPEPNLKEPCKELQQPILLDDAFTSPVDGKPLSPPSPENMKPLAKPQRSCVDQKSLPPFPENVEPLEKVQHYSVDEKSLSPTSLDNVKPLLTPIDENVVEVAEAQETEPDMPPAVGQESESDVGYFRRIWRKWFGSKVDVSGTSHNNQEHIQTSGDGTEKEGHDTLEKHRMYFDNSGKGKYEEQSVTSTSQIVDPVPSLSSSSPHNESSQDSKTTTSSEVYADKSRPGLFDRIVDRCKFWRSSPSSDKLSDPSCDRVKLMKSHTQEHKLFSEDFFWDDIESFMGTPKGSVIVSESRTRKQMALNLQKEGPLFLRSLATSDLLQLVDLLISEKKWVKECASQMSPFELAQRDGETSLNHSHHSNRLSSIFSGKPSRHDMQRSPVHDGEETCKNIPHTGVSLPSIKNRLSDKSRSEILADCQKLVNEKLKEYPGGYNMGLFRKAFHHRYGYRLDLNMLGYEKLALLLQTMDGVKVDSSHIYPFYEAPEVFDMETVPCIKKQSVSHTVVNSYHQFSDSRKEDASDSPWDELGPVTSVTMNKNEVEAAPRRKEMRSTCSDYELPFSDASDSDGEASPGTASERQGKGRVNKEDSSLLQILDSWYSNKSGDNSKDNLENVGGTIDYTTVSKLSASSGVGTNLENHARKSRHVKSYSFVADTVGGDKDKLIDGILGSLKKSSDPKMES